MSHILTQTEADYFFGMEKYCEEEVNYRFPIQGEKLSINFLSKDKRENFIFDIYRGSIKISKITYQNRVRKAYILRRLDIDGPTHTNPEADIIPLKILEAYNGKEVPTPHMHLYIEGYGERWAIPSELVFKTEGGDLHRIMEDFFKYCNVIKLPKVTKNLFI